jgi:hypothetical protein
VFQNVQPHPGAAAAVSHERILARVVPLPTLEFYVGRGTRYFGNNTEKVRMEKVFQF